MKANLIWATPNGDQLVGHLARVSNPKAELGDDTSKLIKYLIDHQHWSPFEMVGACVEIETTRDVGRQILRHRSFKFQEFSGRYAAYEKINTVRECRMQDSKNRQSSLDVQDQGLLEWWNEQVEAVADHAGLVYEEAMERGVAKEVARALLPEGLVPTRMYMQGDLRSWIHYFNVRCTPETQKEHRQLAQALRAVVIGQFPQTEKALNVS